MPLLDVRKRFIEFSGRYDLVVDQDEWADNGADFFIRSGQKWLDRFGLIYKDEARHFVELTSGDFFALVPSRTVREVWVIGDDWKRKLKKKDYDQLHRYCGGPQLITPSCPKYYAIAPIRTYPEVDHLTVFDHYDDLIFSNQYYAGYVTLRNAIDDVYTLVIDSAHQVTMLYGVAPTSFQGVLIKDIYNGAIFNSIQMTAFNNPSITLWLYPDMSGQLYVDTTAPPGPILDVGKQLDIDSVASTADYVTATTIGEFTVHIGDSIITPAHYANTGIVFYPPASDGQELEVIGAFHQAELLTDADMNYWTEEQPIILVMAACRAIEISYRNKEGVADWEAAIKQEILGLEFDLAEMESNEIHQMEG